MTYRFDVNALSHGATLLGYNFRKENSDKIIIDFIVYFDRKSVISWRCPIPPKNGSSSKIAIITNINVINHPIIMIAVNSDCSLYKHIHMDKFIKYYLV